MSEEKTYFSYSCDDCNILWESDDEELICPVCGSWNIYKDQNTLFHIFNKTHIGLLGFVALMEILILDIECGNVDPRIAFRLSNDVICEIGIVKLDLETGTLKS